MRSSPSSANERSTPTRTQIVHRGRQLRRSEAGDFEKPLLEVGLVSVLELEVLSLILHTGLQAWEYYVD